MMTPDRPLREQERDASALETLYRRGLVPRRDFMVALAALGYTASRLEGLFGSAAPAEAAPASNPTPADLYLVLIVMDGFRADYATLAPMHHLRALMARGMTYDTAWVGHLESETPTGHATIATGVYPRRHGVIGFGWRDVASNSFVYLPTDLTQIMAGGLTRTIAQGGVPTLSDLIHARNQHDITISLSGEKYYAAASMGAGADFVLYGGEFHNNFRPISIGQNAPPPASGYETVSGQSDFASQDFFAADLAIRLLDTLRPRALLVNLPDVDIAGHYYGGMRSPRDMTSIVKGADAAIARIVDAYHRLGMLERTIFVVTADHGMAANRHIVPIHPIYRAVAKDAGGGSIDEELRISMGSIWLRQPEQDRSLAEELVARRFAGVEGALYKVPSGSGWTFDPDSALAARFPRNLLQAYLNLAATEACPAGPEVVLPYAEDTMGLTVAGHKRWGTHGGFSWGVQHIPLVIAGPGVRHGVSHFPAKLVDVAPTVERLLGLPIPAGVDGVVLADALGHPSTAERKAQGAVHAPRLADAQALQAHSAAQSHAEDW